MVEGQPFAGGWSVHIEVLTDFHNLTLEQEFELPAH